MLIKDKGTVQSMKKTGLVLSGAVAGVLLSLGLTAYADKKDGVGVLPVEDVQKFSQVLSMIKNNYVDEVSDKELINNAIAGMVKELDPHSAYFDEKEFKDLQESISGKFSGVGLEVQPGLMLMTLTSRMKAMMARAKNFAFIGLKLSDAYSKSVFSFPR